MIISLRVITLRDHIVVFQIVMDVLAARFLDGVNSMDYVIFWRVFYDGSIRKCFRMSEF